MVNDAAIYSELFQKEASFSRISLEKLIPDILAALRKNQRPPASRSFCAWMSKRPKYLLTRTT